MYKGVLIINSGAWQRQTDFQESVGITPTPGMAIIVNLQTMKVYQKDFRVRESDFIEPKHAEPAPLSWGINRIFHCLVFSSLFVVLSEL